MRFTKGPWRIEENGIGEACVFDEDLHIVAIVEHSKDSSLIAAAPDLYEALTVIDEANDDVQIIPPVIRTMIKKALKKARGE